MTERKMARIVRIDNVEKHPNADSLDICTVGGWRVISKLGEYKVGDLAVYCEVDSWIPTEIASFLSKGKEPREYNGVKGERLRTVKLRGELSQGLLLPVKSVIGGANLISDAAGDTHIVEEEQDVSSILSIVKYEPPIPAQLAGNAKGNFPAAIPKTDQIRVQNITREVKDALDAGTRFEITEKLEGTSVTIYRIQGEFGVCSRNLDLKPDDANTYWRVAIDNDINANMMSIDPYWDFAVQGEICGPGIQGNIYNLSKPTLYVFDVYDIQAGRYLDSLARRDLISRMDLLHVPVLEEVATIGDVIGDADVLDIVKFADGKSAINNKQDREGVVFKQIDGDFTFKIVSNRYLLAEKD